MRQARFIVLGWVVILSVVACADASDVTQGTDGQASATSPAVSADTDPSASPEVAGVIAALESDLDHLAAEIDTSAAAAELQVEWEEFQTELAGALTVMKNEGAIDVSDIESEVEEFGDDLTALGDRVEPEVLAAWDTLRGRFEQLVG
jgi:hypothetical protein